MTCRNRSISLLQNKTPETLCRRHLSNRAHRELHALPVEPVQQENAGGCRLLLVLETPDRERIEEGRRPAKRFLERLTGRRLSLLLHFGLVAHRPAAFSAASSAGQWLVPTRRGDAGCLLRAALSGRPAWSSYAVAELPGSPGRALLHFIHLNISISNYLLHLISISN